MKGAVLLASGFILGVAVSVLAVVMFALMCCKGDAFSLPQSRKDR